MRYKAPTGLLVGQRHIAPNTSTTRKRVSTLWQTHSLTHSLARRACILSIARQSCLAMALTGAVLCVGVGCQTASDAEPEAVSTGVDDALPIMTMTMAAPLLEVGARLPPLQAAGWFNGQPEDIEPGQVVLLDVWAQW